MSEIGEKYNYDDVFIRIVSTAALRLLSKKFRYINRFEDGTKIRTVLPVYLSLANDERFVFDAFLDDITDCRVDLNTDQLQRGVLTFNNITINSSEFANPNQYISEKAVINDEIRRIISKVKAVPVSLTYDTEIHASSLIEASKIWQKITCEIYGYRFFRFEYYGITIDAFFKLPDDLAIDFNKDQITLESDKLKKISFPITIKTYFPIFGIDVDDLEVCDNDDEFDWDYLGVPRPTLDYCKSLKNYYKSKGIENPSCNMNSRVFWKNYLYKLNESIDPPTKSDGTIDINNWKKENL